MHNLRQDIAIGINHFHHISGIDIGVILACNRSDHVVQQIDTKQYGKLKVYQVGKAIVAANYGCTRRWKEERGITMISLDEDELVFTYS